MSSNEERQVKNQTALLEAGLCVDAARRALGAEGVKSGQCRGVLNALDSVAGTISLLLSSLPEPVKGEPQDTTDQGACSEPGCEGVEADCDEPDCVSRIAQRDEAAITEADGRLRNSGQKIEHCDSAS